MQNLPSSFSDIASASLTASAGETVAASNARAADKAHAAASEFANTFANQTTFAGQGSAHGSIHFSALSGHISSADGVSGNVSDASGEGYASFIEAGRTSYTGVPAGFASIGPKNGTISAEEALILRQKLQEKNAHPSSLEALNQLIASGQSLTIASLSSALTGTMRLSEPLSDDERATLRVLFGKCGLNTLEADSMFAASDEGRNKEIWNALAAKTAEKNITSVDLTKKEALALLKGMDMSENTTKAIMKQFGDKDSLSLSMDDLNDFFAAVRSELTDKSNAARVVRGMLPDAVKGMLEASKLNAKTDPVADMRGSRSADRLEIRMNETMQEKLAAGMASDRTLNEAEIDVETPTKQELTDNRNREGNSTDQFGTLSAKSVVAEKSAVSHLGAVIEVSTPETGVTFNNGQANLDSLAKAHKQEIFDQVKAGLVQTNQNGATRLTLQLDPKDLGQLTLIISAHQGELRAVIRAENAETAAVITEQLAALRQTLEEQGLKVAELEVRTGLEDHPGSQQWQTAEERNRMLESRDRDRAMRLAKIRSDAGSSHKEAITVQNSRQNSGGRLYIVA